MRHALPQHFFTFALNPRAVAEAPSPSLVAWLGRGAAGEVRRLLDLCPRHVPSPLHRLDTMAAALGLAAIDAKFEGDRLGLNSFKALGGAYAVADLVLHWASARPQRQVAPHELGTPEVKRAVAGRTVCCATAGNHGLSVAAGAQHFGCRAVIFVHHNVAEVRRARLRAFGAEIVEIVGTYDDSVDACGKAATANGWQLVSDTSCEAEAAVPARVMRGYTVLVSEALAQMAEPPTHVIVQGGVGGLAGSVAGHLADAFGAARPMIVVVEPDRAACLMASAVVGQASEIAAGPATAMAMLECFRASAVAWPVIDRYIDAFIALPDSAAADAVSHLAHPAGNDPAIFTTESGGVGLAGLIAAAQDPAVRATLRLDRRSRALVVITEGDATYDITRPSTKAGEKLP